jgi:dolichyl-phosphate-mannose-protein mannosyltransferase
MMGRILYFHHFYSAFIFNCMLTGSVVELLLARCSDALRAQHIRCAFLLLILLSFVAFAPLAYGIPVDEDRQTYGYVKWFKWFETWGF